MRLLQLTLLILIHAESLWAQVLTLQQCYDKAERNYPLIKQYDLIGKSEEYTLSNAGKSYLPQVSLTGIAGYIIKGLPNMSPLPVEEAEDKFQFIGIAQVNQTIWDGGATHSRKEIIQANAEVEKANVDVAMHKIRERIDQLYFGILLLDEQLNLSKILADNLNRNLNAVKLSSENGLAYSSDVDEVKVELLKVEQRETEINHARAGYIQVLALLIGEGLPASLQLEKPVLDEAYESLEVHRPELNLYQNQRRLVEAQDLMTNVNNMPKIGLLGAGFMIQPGVAFGTEKLNSLAIAGLSISWNTGGVYQTSNNKELTKINLNRISNEQETFLFNTNLAMTQQGSDIEKQRAIIGKDVEIVKLKTNIKKAYELKYENGMCTMTDLLLATNSEAEARANQALHETQLLLSLHSYKTISGN